MIDNSNTPRIAPARTAPPRWSPYAWMAAASGVAAVGLWLSMTSTPLPGAEPMTVEDPVDMVCLLLFGFLGAELLRRGIAEGLGRALVLMGALQGANYLLAGIGDAVTDGLDHAPVVAQLCSIGAEVLFIGTFFLLIYAPLALFPTGRLPGPRWHWLTWAAVLGFLSIAVSIVFAPGPVDEDNPATGANPLGLEDLAGFTSALEILGSVLLAITLVGGIAAFVVRWVRYRGARRRQLAWFTAAVVTLAIGMVTDFGGTVLVEVATALAVFGTLLVGMGWPLLGPLGRKAIAEEENTQTPAFDHHARTDEKVPTTSVES